MVTDKYLNWKLHFSVYQCSLSPVSRILFPCLSDIFSYLVLPSQNENVFSLPCLCPVATKQASLASCLLLKLDRSFSNPDLAMSFLCVGLSIVPYLLTFHTHLPKTSVIKAQRGQQTYVLETYMRVLCIPSIPSKAPPPGFLPGSFLSTVLLIGQPSPTWDNRVRSYSHYISHYKARAPPSDLNLFPGSCKLVLRNKYSTFLHSTAFLATVPSLYCSSADRTMNQRTSQTVRYNPLKI